MLVCNALAGLNLHGNRVQVTFKSIRSAESNPLMHSIPASLLLVMASEAALRLRLDWLERAGYTVKPASSLKDVEQACHSQAFDIVLMADAVEPRMKKAIGMAVRHFFPEAPILQMGRIRPDIDGDCFVTGDSREDLLESVAKILRRDEIRPAAI
jgi:CheY-like chemotaxis protein